jgi:hypothetical protein
MHIMDIFQNSVSAKASMISIDIDEDTQKNYLQLTITDNGCGMTDAIVNKVTDPFFTTRTTRKVGLGLPLLKQNAERTGGFFRLESKEGEGTRMTAQFVLDNIDRPVLGDIPGTVILMVMGNPGIGITYNHKKDGRNYNFSTMDVKEALGDIPLNEPSVYKYLREMITENLSEIGVELTS